MYRGIYSLSTLIENLVLQKDISDISENSCWSVGERLSRENQKPILATFFCTNLEILICLIKHIDDRRGLLHNIFRARVISEEKVYALFLWNERFYVQLT